MTYHYNVTGAERKNLVNKIAEITGQKAEYMKVPTCAYKIGYYTVDKTGALSWGDMEDADPENLDRNTDLIQKLEEAGFISDEKEIFERAEEQAADAPETETEDTTGLTVSLPISKVAVGNLTNLLTAKGTLIKKALGIDDLGIAIEEDKVSFPWFKEMPEPDEVKAYTHLIAALGKMSKDLKRTSAKEHEIANEKYEFRCFLLRLGFIGSEYKDERKILLRNLSGNSSWKNGAPEKEVPACE